MTSKFNGGDLVLITHSYECPELEGQFGMIMGMTELEFDDEDIIISVDADEIIYGESYEYILDEVKKNDVVRLNLYQFFYKMNYLWEDKDFVSPIATKYKVFRGQYPCNFRDVGKIVSNKVGCHFS